MAKEEGTQPVGLADSSLKWTANNLPQPLTMVSVLRLRCLSSKRQAKTQTRWPECYYLRSPKTELTSVYKNKNKTKNSVTLSKYKCTHSTSHLTVAFKPFKQKVNQGKLCHPILWKDIYRSTVSGVNAE